VSDVRTGLVSFTDPDGLQHSVEITAGAFSEAAIITHERHEGARLVQAIHADD
jgi:hypothetical protein